MQLRPRRFALLGSGLALGLAVFAHTHPGWAFAHAETHSRVTLHSTRPLPATSAALLASVRQKLARIPFLHAPVTYDVFVCDDDWRWTLFTLHSTRSAAVARAPFSRDVIVRGADFTRNRYRQASGADAPPDRPLDYLLAHELTHLAVADYLGPRRALALPSWVNEGYADYIAGRSHTGRYATYAFLIAHLLEREGWTVEALLKNPPAKAAVEARARL